MISIVEDDESLRNALIGFLRSMAKEARGYGSAEEFLAERDGATACIITDIHLPRMDGIAMTRRLRERGDDVPVILITARDDEKCAMEAKANGVLCLLHKPFEMQALLDCLDRALGA
ncbi:response regulator transcription factor [Sphingomonas sp. PR090111-T3T-6A]|uniref:response regulator transcription factor n=1 Tax=Sphingomonas sp. PR090111-T3T-6A TaxID=685778 RepID=UPI00138AE2DC|nr:response regulator [Sphingomonas sp. PR090111-T3T-6A]